jgi:hypothetical protein
MSRGCCPPQNLIQEEGSQAEGHTQTLNLDDWIITCKEYKPGDASDPTNKTVEQDERRSYHI